MAEVHTPVADSPAAVDRQALLTVLTTEHFTLQGARGSTVGESSARAALYVGAVSSGLVALGFLGQGADRGRAFEIFALVLLPTLYMLGVFTFVRLVESSIEDLFYGRAINRIRQYYLQLAGSEAHYIVLGAHDDPAGVLANMGIARPSRWQLLFTLAAMVGVLNSVVGGSAVAFLAAVLGAPLGGAAAVGGVAGVVSLVAFTRWQRRAHTQAKASYQVLHPSPEAP
jgi:small-conductance mechanosensitive channel